MKREIIQKGAPILEEVALPFNLEAQTVEITTVANDITDTLQYLLTTRDFTKGLGLAAPQIGHSRRAFGLAPTGGDITIYLNPEIIEKSAETDLQYEGCLSFFNVRGLVRRALEIRMRYFDRVGAPHEGIFTTAKARLIQHEVDHLDGILYDQRMEGHPLLSYTEYLKVPNRAWVYDDSLPKVG